MAKGRHRRPQQTQTALPAGARVLTGKGRSAAKQAAYSLPLPIKLDVAEKEGGTSAARPQRQASGKSRQSQSWRQFLANLIGWGADASQTSTTQQDALNARPDIVTGQWDPLTRSVHVQVTRPTDDGRDAQYAASSTSGRNQTEGMRMLWECGFFGKGTLSRSEPTWRSRQISTIRIKRQQARGQKIFTPEELTALRRKERKAAKIERARLAVRAGQQLADGIVALGGELTEEDERAVANEVQREIEGQQQANAEDESAYGKHIPGLIYLKPKAEGKDDQKGSRTATGESHINTSSDDGDEEYIDVEDMETLQLSAYETLFLAGMLGVLEVVDEAGQVLSLQHLYALLLSDTLPASVLKSSSLATPTLDRLDLIRDQWSRPDNPFLLTYVAYHHFRSLGWVVRSGVKFCVDLLLYKKGPAFSHAEFAVVVLPVYEDQADAESSPFAAHQAGQHQDRDWVWFSSVNRVNTQVLKTLILCYVVVPSMKRITSESLSTPQGLVEGLQSGESYHVREYAVRRFTPQRMRA